MSDEEIRSLSTSLYEVFDDIGLDDESVNQRRQCILYHEALYYLGSKINCTAISDDVLPMYMFGSQSEGTTTADLNSDTDHLVISKRRTVIQDIKYWQKSHHSQYLMIQDGTVTPGYCYLQPLLLDSPCPIDSNNIMDENWIFLNDANIVVLKNTVIPLPNDQAFWNGPAINEPGIDMDFVRALPCPQWPKGARIPTDDRYPEKWPTKIIKEQAEATGCLVVPVGSKKNTNEQSRKEESNSKMENETNDFEWRISTSKAERILMFSLNTTQRKCIVLLKMTLKTFFYPVSGKIVTSYMCKNIVFHMIAKTDSEFWTKHNLLRCLICCLEELKRCIAQEKCDHFIMPDYNLMWRKFSEDVKVALLEILNRLLQTNIHIPFFIQTDDLGVRLYMKLKEKHPEINIFVPQLKLDDELKHASITTKEVIIRDNDIKMKLFATKNLGAVLIYIYDEINLSIQDKPDMLHGILEIIQNVKPENDIDNESLNVATQDIESSIKSMIGCVNVSNEYNNDNNQSNTIPNKQKSESDDTLLEGGNKEGKILNSALQWFPEVVHQDNLVASLKKATILYRMGKLDETEEVLVEIEKFLNTNIVMTICLCSQDIRLDEKTLPFLSDTFRQKKPFKTSLCATFLQCEIHCLPKELQYEFFKFPWQQNNNPSVDKLCIDWASVDITVYLYFLQFKIYQCLKHENKKLAAFNNMFESIPDIINDNSHSEVALNIIGQCLEQENRLQEALHIYILSHLIQTDHTCNAAIIHICKLLCTEIYKNVHRSQFIQKRN